MAADFPDRPVRYYHMYEKDQQTQTFIPEDFKRYIIDSNGIRPDHDFVLPPLE